MMMRIKMIVEYDGTPFKGWQRQEDGILSVQGVIEDAIHAFCQQRVTIHAAGRTDAGVHAVGQVIHADLDLDPKYQDGFFVLKAINAHLREYPVSILAAECVPDDFHARFSAREKEYVYRIVNRSADLALDLHRAWVVHPDIDLDAMRAASAHLVGHHDFTSFRDSECQAKSPIKTLDALDVTVNNKGPMGLDICVQARARSFLHHQVRNMVGTIVQVGLGRFSPDDIPRMLAARDRSAAGVTAPACGLYLLCVSY
jgi:tRNA pseudouridine38-40 synthase